MSCTQVAAAAKSAIASIDKRECRKEGPMDTCVREYIPCRVCGCFLLQFCSNVQGPREGKRKLGGGGRTMSNPVGTHRLARHCQLRPTIIEPV
jgi:hypothetical protein